MANKRPTPRLQNLKPFKKGDPRINRKGPPVLPNLKELMAKVLGDEKKQQSTMERIIRRMEKKALAGDLRAAEMLKEWGFGRVTQVIDHTINEGRQAADALFPPEAKK